MYIQIVLSLGLCGFLCASDHTHVSHITPNPTEQFILQFIADNRNKKETLYNYAAYKRKQFDLHLEDARLHFQNIETDEQVHLAQDTPTENGYIPTHLLLPKEKLNVVPNSDQHTRIIKAVGVMHDIDHLLVHAKHATYLKRRCNMHPNASKETNKAGRSCFINILARCCGLQENPFMSMLMSNSVMRQGLHYPAYIPYNASPQEADADLFALYNTQIPGLTAYFLGCTIYMVEEEKYPYHSNSLQLRDQRKIVYQRWKENPQGETLSTYFHMNPADK